MAADDPQDPRYQQAVNLYQQGDREQALALLYSLVTVKPDHLEAWWAIARIAPYMRQKQEAVRHVLDLDPTHEGALNLAERIEQLNVATPVTRLDENDMPSNVGPPTPLAVPHGKPVPPPGYPPYEAPGQPGYGQPPAPPPGYVPAPYSPPAPPPEEPETRRKRRARQRAERAEAYAGRNQGELQPFLVVNGGCTSGCFSLVLTLLTVAVLSFLLVGGSIQQALQEAGALRPDQGTTASIVAAISMTVLVTAVQSLLGALPIDLSGIIPTGSLAAGQETLYNRIIDGVWSLFGYPTNVGDTILARLSTLGPQLERSAWIVLAVFLGIWVILAFLFVFLRARSNRLMHWFLSTVGLWIMGVLAIGLGLLLYRVISGTP